MRRARELLVRTWRIFLAGKGFSFRTGQYFGEAMLVGAATGLVVVAFRYMIDLGHRFVLEGIGGHSGLSRLGEGMTFSGMFSREALMNPHRWIMVLLPAVGACLGYLIIRRFASVEHVRGTDSAIRAFHHRGGNIPGAQGVPEDMILVAVKHGVCKVNIDTDLRLAMTAEIRRHFVEHPEDFDPRKYLGPARDAIKRMVQHKIRNVLNASGQR